MRASTFGVLLVQLLACTVCDARVLRIEVESRQDVLHGKAFGTFGPYERLTGHVEYSVAVDDPHNAAIVDLRNAPARAGEVTFSSDFVALKPKDTAKGNGAVLLEIPNRGHSGIVSLVDGGDPDAVADAGDGWLLRNGYTVVSLGWQWDATGADALKLHAPVARAPDGSQITGLLRGDLMPSREMAQIPLGHLIIGRLGGKEYPVADANDARNVLTVRDSRTAPRQPIPRSEWQFARLVDGKLVPSDDTLHLNGGFHAGKIYEYVYVVADPVVAGLGFAAVRDFAAYLKSGVDPAWHTERVYGQGISQNGRFLRDFLYQGFNATESGARALDGVLAHVAGAGRGSFNYRFAQPSRDAEPTSAVFFPTDLFPFTDLPETDPLSGEHGGLLDRAASSGTVPRIFLSNTSYEYWGRAAALIHVSADGRHDVRLSPDVRIYQFTGLQHFSGPTPPARGQGDLLGQEPESPLPVRFFWRAMIRNMDAWVRKHTAPPPSSYPRLDARTLVKLQDYSFPAIPGVNVPHEASEAFRLDFGPDFRVGVLSLQPPRVGEAFPVLVPRVDADGNERSGVRLPEITVPLATYTPWNLRDPSIGAPGERVCFEGSFLPFPRDARDRAQVGDPRLSIAERYRDRDDYLARFGRALDELIAQRWVLEEDRDALLERGRREWDELVTEGSQH